MHTVKLYKKKIGIDIQENPFLDKISPVQFGKNILLGQVNVDLIVLLLRTV